MLLTTDCIPPRERAEAVRTAIWESVLRLEIDHLDPTDIQVTATITDLGPVNLCALTTTPLVCRRTAALTKDDVSPSLFLQLQVAGTAVVEQAGRRAVLAPGEFTFIDSRFPYAVTHRGRDSRINVRVPLATLNVPDEVVRGLPTTTFGPDRPLAALVVPFVRRLAAGACRRDLPTDPATLSALGQSTLQLVRGLAIAQQRTAGSSVHRDMAADSLEERIMEFVRGSLTNPDLDARMIARAHGISVRYLYKVLARTGVTLGDWIRDQRLELCRHALRELPTPRLRGLPSPPLLTARVSGI